LGEPAAANQPLTAVGNRRVRIKTTDVAAGRDRVEKQKHVDTRAVRLRTVHVKLAQPRQDPLDAQEMALAIDHLAALPKEAGRDDVSAVFRSIRPALPLVMPAGSPPSIETFGPLATSVSPVHTPVAAMATL